MGISETIQQVKMLAVKSDNPRTLMKLEEENQLHKNAHTHTRIEKFKKKEMTN